MEQSQSIPRNGTYRAPNNPGSSTKKVQIGTRAFSTAAKTKGDSGTNDGSDTKGTVQMRSRIVFIQQILLLSQINPAGDIPKIIVLILIIFLGKKAGR